MLIRLDVPLKAMGGATTGGGGAAIAAAQANKLDALIVENGFLDRTDSTFSFSDPTRTFEISPAVTSYEFISGDTKYTKSAQETVAITDTEGLWFFYFDTTGTLIATQTFTDEIITTYAFVALIYWDATNNTAITLAEERHGAEMDSQSHLYNHNTFGTRYGTGLAPGDIQADGTGNVAADAQVSCSGGVIWDEDLEISISSFAAGANIPFFYIDGAALNWRKLAGNTFLAYNAGSGRARYNNENAGGAGVWGLTEVGNGNFLCMHLYATNDVNEPFWFIIGQQEYTTVNNARAGAASELLNLETGALPVVEYVAVATFIVQTSNSYSNGVQSRVRTTDNGDEYIDWRGVSVGVAASIAGSTNQVASQVPFTPTGDIAATDVQAAIEELDTEKASKVYSFNSPTITTNNYTAVLADADANIIHEMDNASACTFTIDALVSWPTGATLNVKWAGVGQPTITGTGGTTFEASGSLLAIAAQYDVVTAIHQGSNVWTVIGPRA